MEPTSSSTTPSSVRATDDVKEVGVDEEDPQERRPMYSMQAVRSRRQAAAVLARAVIDEADALVAQNTYTGGLRADIGAEEQSRQANDTPAAGHVDSGEFGSRSIRKGDREARISAFGEGDADGNRESSKQEDRRLEGKGKIRGMAILLGLARHL